MTQFTQKKSNKTYKNPTNKPNQLGKAPNDIYNLEHEIASIHSEKSPLHLDQKQNDQKDEDLDNYQLFSTSDLSQAKQSLQNGSNIKVKLPPNPSPHALIAMAHSLGFDPQPLQQIFANSSVAVKNILDSYVTETKEKYSSLSNMKHPYQSSAFGYLFHCKQVDALQCDDDLSAKIRISMNLDYNHTVVDDNLFKTKFIYELSKKVFKCSPNNIRVQDVRAGSVIVIIAGITLITLAAAGLLALSVRLHHRKQKRRQISQRLIDNKPEKSSGCVVPQKRKHKVMKPMNVNTKPVAVPVQQTTFVSSIFNKIKTGINSFNDNYITPQGPNNTDIDGMYGRLVEMGFNDVLSRKAAHKYPANINEAMNWIIYAQQHENDEDICPDIVGKAAVKMSVNATDEVKKENLMLHMNDALWVNKNDYFWAATVIALSRDKVTVEYDNGGPYKWRKTETFGLNDTCLVQKEPGTIPQFEGCVEISKSNGGYIKAWKSGLHRPMADL